MHHTGKIESPPWYYEMPPRDAVGCEAQREVARILQRNLADLELCLNAFAASPSPDPMPAAKATPGRPITA